jgi:hypothetical protein
MPSYFEALNMDFRYQLTCIGTFAQAIVAEKVSGNQFKIKTDKPNVEVSWQVSGVRHDKYAVAHPLIVEKEKSAAEKGKYLNPQLYGAGTEKQIGLSAAMASHLANNSMHQNAVGPVKKNGGAKGELPPVLKLPVIPAPSIPESTNAVQDGQINGANSNLNK